MRAALTQFDTDVDIRMFRQVSSAAQVEAAVREASANQAIIVHTLVKSELRQVMFEEGKRYYVHTVDLMGPMLGRLSDLLQSAPLAQPGLFSYGTEEYRMRIEAMDFAFRHDDGRHTDELDQAEIVLVGVSRTGKTPLSVYLAYRGWFVGNVPVVPEVPLTEILFRLPSERVIALTIEPRRLVQVRRSRADRMAGAMSKYVDLGYVQQEVSYALRLFRQHGWRQVDMTSKPIEEATVEIVGLMGGTPAE
jgi:regulator of PEP synthase PpsR (kinase-PPPase family)